MTAIESLIFYFTNSFALFHPDHFWAEKTQAAIYEQCKPSKTTQFECHLSQLKLQALYFPSGKLGKYNGMNKHAMIKRQYSL